MEFIPTSHVPLFLALFPPGYLVFQNFFFFSFFLRKFMEAGQLALFATL